MKGTEKDVGIDTVWVFLLSRDGFEQVQPEPRIPRQDRMSTEQVWALDVKLAVVWLVLLAYRNTGGGKTSENMKITPMVSAGTKTHLKLDMNTKSLINYTHECMSLEPWNNPAAWEALGLKYSERRAIDAWKRWLVRIWAAFFPDALIKQAGSRSKTAGARVQSNAVREASVEEELARREVEMNEERAKREAQDDEARMERRSRFAEECNIFELDADEKFSQLGARQRVKEARFRARQGAAKARFIASQGAERAEFRATTDNGRQELHRGQRRELDATENQAFRL